MYIMSSFNTYAKLMGYKPVIYNRLKPRKIGRGAPRKPTLTKDPTIVGPRPRMGQRVRTGRSYTKTKTKIRTKVGGPRKQNDNSSISSNYIGKGKMNRGLYNLSKNVIAPQTLDYYGSGNLTCTQGRQSVNSFDFLTLGNLNTIKSSITASNTNIRLFLKTARFRITMRNQSNVNARMAIYDIVTKMQTPSISIDTPVEAWVKGSTDFGDANAPYYIGQTPFKSGEFRRYFAVNKVTYVNMEPGQQHEHIVYHKYNRLVDSSIFENQVGTAIKGITRFCVVVFYGHLAHQTDNATNVTTCPVNIDYMVNRQWSYGWLSNVLPTMTITNTIPTNILDLDQMAEDQDKDLDPISA